MASGLIRCRRRYRDWRVSREDYELVAQWRAIKRVLRRPEVMAARFRAMTREVERVEVARPSRLAPQNGGELEPKTPPIDDGQAQGGDGGEDH